MNLAEVVQVLSREMGVTLGLQEITQFEPNVTGAKLHGEDRLYGAITLITSEAGDIQSCAYLGEYPGQTGVKRDKTSLDLEVRDLPFSREKSSRLVRVDHNPVDFLGEKYDGWDAGESNHHMGRAAGYTRRLLGE